MSMCYRCGTEAMPGSSRCQNCEYLDSATRRLEQNSGGERCTYCGKSPVVRGQQRCQECFDRWFGK